MIILYSQRNGSLAIITPAGDLRDSVQDVPEGVFYEKADPKDMPGSRVFRDSWRHDTSASVNKVYTDVAGALATSHTLRRKKRDKDIAPFDDIVAKQIPGQDAVAAEAARVAIRADNSRVQLLLDTATNADEMLSILQAEGIV